MHYKNHDFRVTLAHYLKLQKIRSDLLDHCQSNYTLVEVEKELVNAKQIIKAHLPTGKTFVHGYLIYNTGIDLKIYEPSKKKRRILYAREKIG